MWIKISEAVWNNVSGYGDSKTITVTPTGTTEWTATSDNSGLTVIKSGNTATLKWAAHINHPAPAQRSATVTFATNPEGASATLTTTQDGVIDRININGLWWSIGNLVADGPNGAKIGAPADGGLYFQFGSLLGWKGGATGDGTGVCTKATGSFYSGSSFNAVNEIAVKPSAFTTIANIGTTWPNQVGNNLYYFGYNANPYASAFTKLSDFTGFSTGALADKGVGDPCTYYLGSTWRVPTMQEFIALGNNAPNSSALAAANAEWTTLPTFGVNFNNNSTKYFTPASGWRKASDGAIDGLVSPDANYWSESVFNADAGFSLHIFNRSTFYHNYPTRRHGCAVRCVSN